MDITPNRSNRRRRRKRSKPAQPAKVEPILIVARRPNSPRLEKPTRRMKAASAKPRPVNGTATNGSSVALASTTPLRSSANAERQERARRREARIVQVKPGQVDERERERLRLLGQFMRSEGRTAISRAAENYWAAGFDLPEEQEVQLKLLEHFDESRARQALEVLARILQHEKPKQLPVFDQRLRRLEEHADDPSTRAAAAELRRALRG